MPEMAHAGEHHGQLLFAAIGDGVIVADGSTRLNKRLDSGGMGNFYAIVKRKKGITGQYCTLQVEIELPGFFNRMTQ